MERGLTDDAPPELDAQALDLRRVAGLEAHPELLGAVVQQQNGEDAVVNDGAHQIGDAVHEGVEVERGVQGIGEAMQKIDLQGLEAGCVCRGGGCGARSIVPFEGVLGGFSEGASRIRSGLVTRRHARR